MHKGDVVLVAAALPDFVHAQSVDGETVANQIGVSGILNSASSDLRLDYSNSAIQFDVGLGAVNSAELPRSLLTPEKGALLQIGISRDIPSGRQTSVSLLPR